MTVDFSDYFWGEKNNGFDVLYHNMKYGLVASKELADFLRERSNIEEYNSKLLTKLAKQAGANCVQGTFAPVWQVLRSSLEKLSNLHLQMMQKVLELVKEVTKYADELHKRHKQVKEEEMGTLEVVQAIQSTTLTLQKAKDTYNQKSLEYDKLRKENATPKELEKAEVKLKKAQEDYRTLVEKYSAIKIDFEKKMSSACKHFQDVEESHLKQMKEFLNSYAEVIQNNHELIGQVLIEFKRQCLEMTVDKLLEQFVLNKYTGLEKPGSIEFEEFCLSGLSSSSNQTPDSSDKTTNGDKPSKKEGNLESGGQKSKESKTSRRTTSLLNLFMSNSQGSKECSGNPEGGSLPTSAPTSPMSGIGPGVPPNGNATSLARNPLRGSKWFLRSRREKRKEKKAKKKKDGSDNTSNKEDKSDVAFYNSIKLSLSCRAVLDGWWSRILDKIITDIDNNILVIMSSPADLPTTRGRRKQAKPQRKNVDLEELPTEDVVSGPVVVTTELPDSKPVVNGHCDEEDRKIREYLQRSDTAVIFPEPVGHADTGESTDPGEWRPERVPLTPTTGKAVEDPTGAEYFIKCSQCHKGYPGFQALKEHVAACHRDAESEAPLPSPGPPSPAEFKFRPAGDGGGYACLQCNTTFLHKDQLEKHKLLHSPNAQVSCKVCNKTFANVYRLQRLMISHDESAVLRKFKCPECDKAFKFKHHLKEHIRIHSGEKPFECANCGKRFSHSGSYSSHMTSKKCLVMNLKVGRGRGPNALLDKCPSQQHRAPGGKRGMNNNITNSSNNNNNAFAPILPKYSDAAAAPFLSAVTPRVPGAYPPASPHPAPSLHPFYMAAAPTMHLSPHPTSAMNPYKLPQSLSHLLEHFTTAPAHSHLAVAEEERKLEEASAEQESSKSIDFDVVATNLKKECEGEEDENDKEKKDDEAMKKDDSMVVEEAEEKEDSERCGSPANRTSPDLGSNSGDLEAVKRILETVNATVTKQLLEANMQKLSSTSSGSDCHSIASAASPSAVGSGLETVGEGQKAPSDDLNSDTCKYCQKKFTSKIELHQHERYLCDQQHDRKSEGLAAKLEEAVTVKTEEMSLNGGFSGSEEEDCEGRGSSKDLVTEEEELEGDSMTTSDQVSEDGRKVRVRSLIADEQLAILKGHYSLNPRPKKDELSRIAEKIGFPVRVVQVWFQNTRARDRREGRLVHVPYLPLSSVPLVSMQGVSNLPSASIVPSTQPSQLHIQAISLGSYSSGSSPLCPSTSAEQPLDLSTKKSQHSLASTPSSSPLRPPSATAQSDSGEEGGGAMNLSRKSSSSRSPTPVGIANTTLRQFLPFQQTHYPHSSCSSSSVAEFRRTPSPLSSLNIHHHTHEGLSNGMSTGSRLARILAQPPVASHRLVAGLTNGTNGGVGLVPMDRLMYGADMHASHSPMPMFALAHHENGRACSSSPSSDKRSWKQGYVDGGDTTDEADDSVIGGVSHDMDHAMGDDDANSPSKRHKLALALAISKGALPPLPGLDGEPEGQFICDQCDKAFSKQSSLARHKYEHSGQRPHKCDVCNKAFKHKHHLTEHKRLHSGEKPFQCSKCLKRFSHSGSYSQHMNHRYSYCKPYRE